MESHIHTKAPLRPLLLLPALLLLVGCTYVAHAASCYPGVPSAWVVSGSTSGWWPGSGTLSLGGTTYYLQGDACISWSCCDDMYNEYWINYQGGHYVTGCGTPHLEYLGDGTFTCSSGGCSVGTQTVHVYEAEGTSSPIYAAWAVGVTGYYSGAFLSTTTSTSSSTSTSATTSTSTSTSTSSTSTTSTSTSTSTSTTTTTSTTIFITNLASQSAYLSCALYGGGGYTGDWIGVNFLVILVSLTVIAFVYTIANLLPARIRSKLVDAVKAELSQILLSAVIIVLLIGSAQLVCGIVANYSIYLTGSFLTPFQYADSYIGNLATTTGVDLLTQIYSMSVRYQVEAQEIEQILDFFTGLSSGLGHSTAAGIFGALGAPIVGSSGLIKSSFFDLKLVLPLTDSFAQVYTSLSALYMGVFSPLVTLATGMLFLQYLLLAVMQYLAFTTILPVAILMRSLAFTGTGLRQSANALLAIAIAMYLVYPLTIAFDQYIMNYALANAGTTYLLKSVTINQFFASFSGSSILSAYSSAESLFLNSVGGYIAITWPWELVNEAQAIINQMAEFLFQAVVLFAINLAITIGFATGLAKALNSGVEGVGSFWNSI